MERDFYWSTNFRDFNLENRYPNFRPEFQTGCYPVIPIFFTVIPLSQIPLSGPYHSKLPGAGEQLAQVRPAQSFDDVRV